MTYYVKWNIHDKEDIPPDRQRLTCASKPLLDCRALTDYNIDQDRALRLTFPTDDIFACEGRRCCELCYTRNL